MVYTSKTSSSKSKKREKRIKAARDKMRKLMIERKIKEIGEEPTPERIKKMMEGKLIRPVVGRSYMFYREKIEPIAPHLIKEITKSRTGEIKIPIDEFSDKIGMPDNELVAYIKSKPFLFMEGISTKLKDGKQFISMKKATKEDTLPKFSKKLLSNICMSDPGTDNPRVLEFQNKVCRFVERSSRRL